MQEPNSHYWDTIAPSYDELYNDEWSQLEDSVTRDMVEGVLAPAGKRVLDIGCGTGLGYTLAKDLDSRVDYTGIDSSPKMIAVAQARFPDGQFICNGPGTTDQYDLGKFDVVLMLNGVLSFVDSAEEALRYSAQRLCAGGKILASALSRYSVRRLVRGRVRAVENFATRGAEGVRHRTIAHGLRLSQLRQLFDRTGFDDSRIQGVGVFSGILQWPKLWGVDRALCRVMPSQAHTLWATGIRR